MAAIALEGTSDVLVHPMNLVGKRYATKETGFIPPILACIMQQVGKSRAQGNA